MVMAELRKEEAFTFILSSSNAVFHQQKKKAKDTHTYIIQENRQLSYCFLLCTKSFLYAFHVFFNSQKESGNHTEAKLYHCQ